MPDEDVSPITGKPYPTLPTPLRSSFGPSLPRAQNLEALCSHALALWPLLEEILSGVSDLERPGYAKVDARAVAGRHVSEVRAWFPAIIPDAVAAFGDHPQFDRIFEAVEEVRVCAECLCSLTFDRMAAPHDKSQTARWMKAAALLQGAVDDLRPLSRLQNDREHLRSVHEQDRELRESSTPPTPPATDGEWSAPMSRAEMARRLIGRPSARARDVESILKRYGLKHVAGRKYSVRLDTMDSNTRRKLDKPA